MGRFVNPSNDAFQVALNSEIYVDKTALLAYTNRVMDTDRAMICNSRPRRFGKSTTANMLAAYYSKGCDSGKLFENLQIAADKNFLKHLNQYDVIHFDMVTFKNKDDVLTALIHLGYLAYNAGTQMAFIPNEEIRSEFAAAVEKLVE